VFVGPLSIGVSHIVQDSDAEGPGAAGITRGLEG
jgi:hypothetical protein